jgi:hypothetical protein
MVYQNSNRRFLVDTGARYSVLPHQSSLPARGPKLFALLDKTFLVGETTCFTSASRARIFPGIFLVKVALPILGADFLSFVKLGVDPCSNGLLDSKGNRLTGVAQPSPPTATVGGWLRPAK